MQQIEIPQSKDEAKRNELMSLKLNDPMPVDQSERQRYADIACELKRHGKGVFRTSKNGPDGMALVWRIQ